MKVLKTLNRFRVREPTSAYIDRTQKMQTGIFNIPLECSRETATVTVEKPFNSKLWEHVSCSLTYRYPTFREMKEVRKLLFEDDEIVIQYHPPKEKYANVAPYCLHLWQYKDDKFKLPNFNKTPAYTYNLVLVSGKVLIVYEYEKSDEWTRVRVTSQNGWPNWYELGEVKKAIFGDDSLVIQLYNLSIYSFGQLLYYPNYDQGVDLWYSTSKIPYPEELSMY